MSPFHASTKGFLMRCVFQSIYTTCTLSSLLHSFAFVSFAAGCSVSRGCVLRSSLSCLLEHQLLISNVVFQKSFKSLDSLFTLHRRLAACATSLAMYSLLTHHASPFAFEFVTRGYCIPFPFRWFHLHLHSSNHMA